jgi:endonuclease G
MIFLNRHILLSTLFAFSILNSTFSQDVYSKIDSIKSEILKLDNQKNSLLSELETFEFSRNKLELIEYVLPKLQSEEKLIEHKAMFLVYDEMHEQAKWVAHKISTNIIEGTQGRSNDFREDTLILSGSAQEKDYFIKTTNTNGSTSYDGFGYDRGHLAPSADFRWSKTALSESYFYSNMSPQLPEFNRDCWAKLENSLRNYVIEKNQSLFIVTGPVLSSNLKKIERSINNVSIPNYFFKAVLDINNQKSVAYLFPHKKNEYPIDYYAISIDSLENITGLDFFSNLEDSLEKIIEQQADFSFLNSDNKQSNSPPIKPENLKKGTFNTVQSRQFIKTNKTVTICGKVVSTHLSKNGHVFLNLDQSFPDQIFSITIWKSNTTNFSYQPHLILKNQQVCVKGKITENKGIPTMSINNEKFIQIK